MKSIFSVAIILGMLIFPVKSVYSFCGFYVAKADASLYNKASRVVLVHNDNKTVITMMNDYEGDLKNFALVVPVPVVLEKEQIHIGDSKTVDHIDAYSAPRLVEYFDPDPCYRIMYEKEDMDVKKSEGVVPSAPENKKSNKDLGVTVEATYTVGEYDIQILSAKFSDGLEKWLVQNGYKIPAGASEALKPYIKQKLKFFVAKVNLKSLDKGLTYLRPLQFAYDSPKFMLPIRLGMINAKGDQDLLLYVLSKQGRVETTNYRTVKLPSDIEVPGFVKSDFANFYRDMFSYQVNKENKKAVFTEYFWNMSWCDPCAAEPLSNQELESLGVFWLNEENTNKNNWNAGPPQVMVTRLHVRYSKDTFPEDLVFQETGDQGNFQGRYIIFHPWTGAKNACSAAEVYFKELEKREEARAQNFVMLTGKDIESVRKRMNIKGGRESENKKWWKKIWN